MVSMRVLKWEVPTAFMMDIELYAHWRSLTMALSIEILAIRTSNWEQESTKPSSLEIENASLFYISNHSQSVRSKIIEFVCVDLSPDILVAWMGSHNKS